MNNRITAIMASVLQKIMLFFCFKEAWAKELFKMAKNEEKRFQEMKESSPFFGKVLIAVSYDNGGTSLYGNDLFTFSTVNGGSDIVSSVIKTAIRKKGWAVHDDDSYILAFEKPDIFGKRKGTGKIEIFWIGCRKPGIKGPEAATRASRPL